MGFFGRKWAGASRRANCHHPPRAQEGSPASAGLQALEDASAAPRSIAGSRLQDDTEDDCAGLGTRQKAIMLLKLQALTTPPSWDAGIPAPMGQCRWTLWENPMTASQQ